MQQPLQIDHCLLWFVNSSFLACQSGNASTKLGTFRQAPSLLPISPSIPNLICQSKHRRGNRQEAEGSILFIPQQHPSSLSPSLQLAGSIRHECSIIIQAAAVAKSHLWTLLELWETAQWALPERGMEQKWDTMKGNPHPWLIENSLSSLKIPNLMKEKILR